MEGTMNRICFRIAFFIVATSAVWVDHVCAAAPNKLSISNSNPSTNWKLRAVADVPDSGTVISKQGYNATAWVNAIVPGTVIASYIAAGLEKEFTNADNAFTINKNTYNRNFWFRTEFTVPAGYSAGIVWLNFAGIYKYADIYLNGTKLGSIRGVLVRGKFDITALLNQSGPNALAVLAYPTDNKIPTFYATQGTDWVPPVPGQNQGIIDDVFLSTSGAVSLVDPWVRSDLALPAAATADLELRVTVRNNSAAAQNATLNATLYPGAIAISKDISLNANETRTIIFDKSTNPVLTIANPRLWWPNGYGKADLCTVSVAVLQNNAVSDAKDISFGIRKFTYDTLGGVLHFFVNGVKIYCKGGNWGMPECLFRLRGKQYDDHLKLHAHLNFNIVRNWTGCTFDEDFYNACDKYGIMVWDDFWLGYWNYTSVSAEESDLFNTCAIEKIKRFRNHACIALWCGENEGTPIEPLNGYLVNAIKTYDADDRRYQPRSNANGTSGSGPYTVIDVKGYFTGSGADGNPSYPGEARFPAWGMRSEGGTPVVPVLESVNQFIPSNSQWPPTNNKLWLDHFTAPPDGSWSNAVFSNFTAAIDGRYGTASTIDDFCKKSQLLSLENYKAFYEGWLDHLWNNASGLMVWMSMAPFPIFVWQLYDYYGEATGAYWAAKKACEPVHIFYSYNGDMVKVANTSRQPMSGLKAEAWIYNYDGSQQYHNSVTVSVTANTLANCFAIPFPSSLSSTYFIKLLLTDNANAVVSENFYWKGTTHLKYATGLSAMAKVDLVASASGKKSGDGFFIDVSVTNPPTSNAIAFANRLKVTKGNTAERILPILLADNYFSLLKGETKNFTIEFDAAKLGSDSPKLFIEGYNSAVKEIPLSSVTGMVPKATLSMPPYSMTMRINGNKAQFPRLLSGKIKAVTVYDISGKLLKRSVSKDQFVDLNGNGVYIVKARVMP